MSMSRDYNDIGLYATEDIPTTLTTLTNAYHWHLTPGRRNVAAWAAWAIEQLTRGI